MYLSSFNLGDTIEPIFLFCVLFSTI